MTRKNICRQLFLIGAALFLCCTFTSAVSAQIQKKRILIDKGSGTFTDSNKDPISFTVDMTQYQKGHINYIFKIEAGPGLTRGGGKCDAGLYFAEEGRYEAEKLTRKPYPFPVMAGSTADLPYELIRPAKFILTIYPNCYKDPKRIGEYTYEIYLENFELTTCPPRTLETNPAEPYNTIKDKSEGQLFDNWRSNGKTFDAAKAGDKYGKDTDILFVNGINTTLDEAMFTQFEIAKITNASVRMVHNSSSLKKAFNVALNKFMSERPSTPQVIDLYYDPDIVQVNEALAFALDKKTADWAKSNVLQNPQAAQSLAKEISDRLLQGKPVNLIVYSQGAAIAAEALRMLQKCFTEKEVLMLGNVRVLSVGGAAANTDFPKNVKVSSIYHKSDGVAMMFGENRKNFKVTDFSLSQHSNYFNAILKDKDRNIIKDKDGKEVIQVGDPKTSELLRKWLKGTNIPFESMPDFESAPAVPNK